MTKTDRVQSILRSSPGIATNQVVAALRKQGVGVTGSLVNKIRRAGSQHQLPVVDTVDTIRKVRSIANQVGGLPKLRELVDALS